MTQTVKARFANGLLTPLEPLDLAEDAVVQLTIEEPPAPDPANARADYESVTDNGQPFIDMSDPKSLKKFLDDAELTHYLRSVGREQ